MKVIECLSDFIECELDKAEDYIMAAVKYKEDFPEISKGLYAKSLARIEDIKSLHDLVVLAISSYRAKEGEPPAPMMDIYDYLHRRHIEMSAAVKRLQELYKNGV